MVQQEEHLPHVAGGEHIVWGTGPLAQCSWRGGEALTVWYKTAEGHPHSAVQHGVQPMQ